MYQFIATLASVSRPLLSDSTWAELDPHAGDLSARGRWQVAATVAACLLLVAGLIVLRASGLAWPNVAMGDTYSSSADPATRTFYDTVQIRNDGWRAERITGISTPMNGVQVTSLDGAPVTIPARSSVTVTIHYLARDCAAVERGPTRLSVRLHRWWGTSTVTLTPPPWLHPTTDELGASVMTSGPAWVACNGPS